MGYFGGGGSSSGGTTVVSQSATDPEAARRMAAVAEQQFALSKEEFGLYKQHVLPTDIATAEYNKALVEANQALLPQQEEASSEYYNQLMAGIDPEQYRGRAIADVEQEFAKLPEALARQAGKSGFSPNDPGFVGTLKSLGLEKAKARAFSGTNAYNAAKTEQFNRLAAAKGVQQTAGVAPYTTTDLAALSSQSAQNAIEANAAGMRPLSQTTSWNKGQTTGPGLGYSILSGAAGGATGALTAYAVS